MQYPTIGQPQYGFAPTMPGMARGGLAALANQYRKGGKIKYFEEGGDSSPTGGADSSTEGGAGAAFTGEGGGGGGGGNQVGGGNEVGGGGNEAGVAAQAAAQAVDNAVAAAQDAAQEAAAEATLAGQVAAEADEAEAEAAANTAATLGAQANAIAAEIAAQAEENAKAETMAAVMSGKVEGFPGPAPAPSFGMSFQSPFNMQGKPMSLTNNPVVNDFMTINTPMGPVGVNALTLGSMGGSKAAQAANAAVNAGRAMGYAEGGVASLANQIQSKGRGQDTMLVHMTPGEVKGLQALAMSQGGSLTINPQTGLPEAGFLSAILPMVAGFALGPAGFGLMSSALGAGAVVGGLTGLATGSLKKGLMAGLGAYGGFGLGQGLTAAATPVEAAATMTPVPPSAPTPAFDMSTVSGSGGDFLAGAPQKTSLLNQSISAPAITPTGIPAVTPQTNMFSAANIPPVTTVQPTGFEAVKSGFENVFKPADAGGAAARKAFGAALPYGTTIAAGVPLASAAAEPPKGPEPSKSFIRGYDLDITNPSGTPVYTPQDTREREQVRYAFSPRPIYEAAQGGLTALNGQTYDDEYGRDEYAPGGSVKKRKVTSLRGNPYYKFAQDRKDSSMEAAVEQNFAKGGLGSALPPRFLSGGGDGMSDSIKARIGGVQEARLADGEFVVPADVVSHLGNGSSKAGAKKLYAMMDKIRKARTGRKSQAPEVNARKYMPA